MLLENKWVSCQLLLLVHIETGSKCRPHFKWSMSVLVTSWVVRFAQQVIYSIAVRQTPLYLEAVLFSNHLSIAAIS